MAISHAGHTHPSTPAARAACRRANDAGGTTHLSYQNPIRDEIRMTGPVARRMAKHAAKADRIQPKRGGARVSIDNSGCVQAALHTGRGKCACGWSTWDLAS
jgi:hypothetical protein